MFVTGNDGGKKCDVGFCFPAGEIKHVHNIVFDRYAYHSQPRAACAVTRQ
jgi:hypothetical protein